MNDFGGHVSRIPLHFQSAEIAKAAKENPSYESFRQNVILPVNYKEMDDRASIHDQARMRRDPAGKLNFQWAANQIIDSIHSLEFNGNTGNPEVGSASLLPIQCALLTIIFPEKYRKMEPQAANILTQLSDSEKNILRLMVMKQMADESTWNSGFGGGSDPLSRPRNVGG